MKEDQKEKGKSDPQLDSKTHQLYEKEEKDKKLQKMFNLENEIVISEFECTLKKTLKFQGCLFISQNYICFAASGIGKKVKEIIKMNDILDIEMKKKTIRITSNETYIFSNFENVDKAYELISSFKPTNSSKKEVSLGHTTSIRFVDVETTIPEIQPEDTFFFTDLNKEDWELILKGKKVIEYKMGEVIIRQGEKLNKIYVLWNGKCKIEGIFKSVLMTNNDSFPVIFGEISLFNDTSTANVIAESENVTIYTFEIYYLNVLFTYYPHMILRFYKYICEAIFRRIKERGLTKEEPTM